MKSAYSLLCLFLAAPLRAQTAPYAGSPAKPAARPEIGSLLLLEAERPKEAPKPGETVWDLAERAAYQARKTRRILEDAEDWSTGIDRPAEEWARARKRMERLEKTYRDYVWKGLDALADSLLHLRAVATATDLLLKEREMHALHGSPAGEYPRDPKVLSPNKESVAALHVWRQEAESSAAKAEELLEKGLGALKKRPRYSSPSSADYLHDILNEAEESVEAAAAKALALSRLQYDLSRKQGAFWTATRALEAYGGRDGKGTYEDKDLFSAVKAAEAAKRRLVVAEYTSAGRIEEMRTLNYLLDRFAKL